MKKVMIIVLVVLLAGSLAGCKSPSEAAAEKAFAEIAGKAAGAKVDIDGEKVTIRGEGGSRLTVGENKWPTDKVGGEIPAMAGGTVTYLYNDDKGCNIILQEVGEDALKDYLVKIQEGGFSNNQTEYSDDINSVYAADNGRGLSIQVSYNREEKMLNLFAGKTEH